MRLVLPLVAALLGMQVGVDMPAAGRIVVFGDVHLENDVRERLTTVA